MSTFESGRKSIYSAKKRRLAPREHGFAVALEHFYEHSPGSNVEKLERFANFATRQTLARFLALSDIFRLALEVQGDVIECGVNWGAGLMSFAQLSAILEPVNFQRRIVGFDTFDGFPAISEPDTGNAMENASLRVGGYAADSYDDLVECISLFDANRDIGHIEKILLVRGDATQTIPDYLEQNPHTVVSLLHLDFDLYEPTKAAIEHLFPLMPKGAVIVFDELNHPAWPGETRAVADMIGIDRLRIRRFPFEPHISYAVIE